VSACSAANSCAGSDEPPKNTGGYGRPSGGNSSFAPLTLRCLPSKSKGSPEPGSPLAWWLRAITSRQMRMNSADSA